MLIANLELLYPKSTFSIIFCCLPREIAERYLTGVFCAFSSPKNTVSAMHLRISTFGSHYLLTPARTGLRETVRCESRPAPTRLFWGAYGRNATFLSTQYAILNTRDEFSPPVRIVFTHSGHASPCMQYVSTDTWVEMLHHPGLKNRATGHERRATNSHFFVHFVPFRGKIFSNSLNFIEHSSQVWYNYNRHRSGR